MLRGIGAAVLGAILASGPGATLAAGEIDFVEDFAQAKDRSVPLRQLIPGTENFYYYHCLHYQNTEQFEKVPELLKLWIERHGRTARVIEIENRQALLQYPQKPDAALALIRERMNLQFNHQREQLQGKPNLPIALDQGLFTRKALAQRAFSVRPDLQGFEDRALDWLVQEDLNPDRRREMLSRLTRPDHPKLAALVMADLAHANSGGFGSLTIHRQLLLSQLEECLKLQPDLIQQTNFVNAYVAKLRSHGDVDWKNDPAALADYLDRVWAFVAKTPPAFNSLKAHVLYHRLVLDRSQGQWDKERFLTYIKLPRNMGYMAAKYLELDDSRRFPADVNADFSPVTQLGVIGNDESLVRSYLHHYFLTETAWKPYEPYINDIYLRELFAEVKLTAGLGSAEQWYSLLPPEKLQALKDRVDIDFAPTNKVLYAAGDKVALDVVTKNVPSLLVKVYEINALNFYKLNSREVNTDINLDGLVANEEKTYPIGEPSLKRVERHFEFAALAKPGVYVIDFIGNGRSSRALVRKGKLQYLLRTTSGGQVFTVLDETNKAVEGAKLWLAGHEYAAEKNGEITVPFSTQPGRQPFVLAAGGLATLGEFQHAGEAYELRAGLYVDREALVSGKKAKILVRPGLLVSGTPTTLRVLDEVTLAITATDLDGVNTTKEIPNFKLFEDRESTYDMQVPTRLAHLSITLRAKVQNLSENKKVDVSASAAYDLNRIDTTDKVEDLHLSRIESGFAIDLLGRSGEPRPERAIQLVLKHRDFRDPVHALVKTDESGRALLGALAEIDWVQATGPEGLARRWRLPADQSSGYRAVHGKAGETLLVSYTGKYAKPDRAAFSLLELRGETFTVDHFEALSVSGGMLQVEKLPAGDYDLLLKETGQHVRLLVTAGEVRSGYVLGGYRKLEQRNPKPLAIASIDASGKETIKIQLQNATKFARVHLWATRFEAEYSSFASLDHVRDREGARMTTPAARTVYIEGRNIGDEYRYILDRRYAQKFPGNMLDRPSLLLQPWATRKTETSVQQVQGGDEFGAKAQEELAKLEQAGAAAGGSAAAGPLSPNLDFLAQGSLLIENVMADEKGVIELKRSDLGGRQILHVLAVDPLTTVYRSAAVSGSRSDYSDLRLVNGLDPKGHFTQQRRVSLVNKGEKFVLEDISTSRLETIDSLPKLFGLYATLTNDARLAEFTFLVKWPALKPEEKRSYYSRFACHELNFFLMKKDPEFFRTVVQPYLVNKKDKTFLDLYLVGDNLAGSQKPWAYARLNAAERALLGQRIAGEQEFTSRHIGEQVELLPPDIERFQFLFLTAIRGSALESDTKLALGDKQAALDNRYHANWAMASGKANADGANVHLGVITNGGAGFAPSSGGRADPAANGPVAESKPGEPASPPAPAAKPARDSEAKDSPADAKRELRSELRRKAGDKLDKAGKTHRGALAKKDAAEESEKEMVESLDDAAALDADGDKFFEANGVAGRASGKRRLYQKLDQTQEWAENNYYHRAIEEQNAQLIAANKFWLDYARSAADKPFRSVNLAEASRNFTEAMFALAVTDLPFEPAEHEAKYEKAKLTLTAAGPLVVYHEEIRPAKAPAGATPILVSQNFFRASDRYRQVNGEQVDKFVTEEFLTHVAYGCQIVVTNPTSARQKIDVLLQLPVGALPLKGSQNTRSITLNLEPYHTQTAEYYFYFAAPGTFPHYPVHVAKNEDLLAFAQPMTFQVVREPSKVDRESWEYISQFASNDDVISYLKKNNLQRLNLEKMAFRLKDKAFFEAATELLAQRHVYHPTIWSYAVAHNATGAVREFLQHSDAFVAQCGPYLESPLLSIDPVARRAYEHLDYSPLVNARAHTLGQKRQILNDRFFAQYHRLMNILCYRRTLDSDDWLAVTYYLLLQDRTAEAIEALSRVKSPELKTRIQYDYFTAYLDLQTEDHKQARAIADKYANYPVDRWRNLFRSVTAQLDELEGRPNQLVDKENRNQSQTNLASSEPGFEFKVEARKVLLDYQNLESVQVNYYLMDVELLFSRNPFVQQFSGQFSYIRPNGTQLLKLDAKQRKTEFELPEQLHNSNVLVEIVGGGQTRAQAYYANSLAVQVVENYGQVKVTNQKTGAPAPKAYVKVYAQMQDGQTKFFKDGYTDLRGRYDYSSLSTNELDFVQKFSILVLSDEYGAVVKESTPPKR